MVKKASRYEALFCKSVRQTNPRMINHKNDMKAPANKKRKSAWSRASPNFFKSSMEITTARATRLTITPGRMRFQLFLVEEIAILLLPNAQHRQKSLLGNFHIPNHLHALLTAFLLFQQFLLTRDITSITLGEHILAHGFNIGARDDTTGSLSLNGHQE